MLSERKSAMPDPQALALSALGWILSDQDRAERLLALTGMTPETLRGRLHDPALLGAVIDFLLGNERDLLAAADELGVAPEAFAQVRGKLA